MDLLILKELLPILAASKVKSLKFEGLELEFQGDAVVPPTVTWNQPTVTPFIGTPYQQYGGGGTYQQPLQPPYVVTSSTSTPGVPLPTNPQLKTEAINDSVLPQGLEEEMPFDKILHWSGSEEMGSVPLTDDVALDSNTELDFPKEVHV